jgi:hypothetical protein
MIFIHCEALEKIRLSKEKLRLVKAAVSGFPEQERYGISWYSTQSFFYFLSIFSSESGIDAIIPDHDFGFFLLWCLTRDLLRFKRLWGRGKPLVGMKTAAQTLQKPEFPSPAELLYETDQIL